MQSKKPLVSAIITTFKRDVEIVEKAIQSIERQTYDNIEIIVVDDNPNESKLCFAIKKMCANHESVRYIKQNGNKGACAARNLGIANSNGQFIGCLDDDDEWLPTKIEKQIDAFNTRKTIGLVFCNGLLRIYEKDHNYKEQDYNRIIIPQPTFKDLLRWDCIGSTSHPLVAREVFEQVGGFWESQPARQDYEMWLRVSQQYNIVGISEKLFIHNIHYGEQISKSSRKAYCGYRNIYKKYKSFYKRDRIAMYYILSALYRNIYSFSVFNCYVIFMKVVYKLFFINKIKGAI